MGESINTNSKALYEIRNSLIRFQKRIDPLQKQLSQVFCEIDEQIGEGVKRKISLIKEKKFQEINDNQCDSFVCDTCQGRIHLKIIGNTTHCREKGCNGMLHRVITDQNDYVEKKCKEELEQIRKIVSQYQQQKIEFLQLFASFFSMESSHFNESILTLSRCIDILEKYLSISFDIESTQENKKNFKRILNKQFGKGTR